MVADPHEENDNVSYKSQRLWECQVFLVIPYPVYTAQDSFVPVEMNVINSHLPFFRISFRTSLKWKVESGYTLFFSLGCACGIKW